jgi:O-antigen/teichoic acid export membrane protein
MPTDSLKKRYLAKLSGNLAGLAFALVTQIIIPRGLGPRGYGDFSFLSNFFGQVVSFLDMGTSIGFYTKLSQRKNDFGLVFFYTTFTCCASVFVFVFVECAKLAGAYSTLWPDQRLLYVYLAAVWGILSWFVQIAGRMADAYGVTVAAEIAKVIQKGIGLVIIVILFFSEQLNLTHFFFYHYFVMVFLLIAFVFVMKVKSCFIRPNWKLSLNEIKAYIKEFYEYSNPLFVYAMVGLLAGILDRWMLQLFAGSEEQGFYGLSYQIGAVCFLFTSAMSPLIMREFSIAFGRKDIPEMALLFRRYLPVLYSMAAIFGCFACANAEKMTYIFGGKQFADASLAVAIMALYPIHQTYGQLSGSVFYATGQTRLYRNIGVFFMILGLPVAYVMIAPSDKMGFDAGAAGLAVKFVVLQFIGVNVQLFYNAKLLNLRFTNYLGHQMLCLSCLLLIAFFVKYLVDLIAIFEDEIIGSFLVSGVLYSLAILALGYCLPVIFGLRRENVIALTNRVHAYISRIMN